MDPLCLVNTQVGPGYDIINIDIIPVDLPDTDRST